MGPARPALLLLLLAACAQPAPRGDSAEGTRANGAPPPHPPAGPCADGPGFAACADIVQAAMMARSGAASRAGDTLRIRTDAGTTIPFVDDHTDGRELRFRYRRWIAPHRFHLLTRTHIEDTETLLVSAADGSQFSVFGDPVFSPDGRRMATASLDLEAGYQPNGIGVWRVREGMVQVEWGVTAGMRGAPRGRSGPTAPASASCATSARNPRRGRRCAPAPFCGSERMGCRCGTRSRRLPRS